MRSKEKLIVQAKELFSMLDDMELHEKIDTLNEIRQLLHEKSPFKHQPVDTVYWVKADSIQANDYNPNTVAPPEMRLLKLSVSKSGYTMPIVTAIEHPGDQETSYVVVDGFHRFRVGNETKSISKSLYGYLPITIAADENTSQEEKIAMTIRHNRARGKHGIAQMTNIVGMILKEGWSDQEAATNLGMDADELLRLKQNTGLPELFKYREYSKSWGME